MSGTGQDCGGDPLENRLCDNRPGLLTCGVIDAAS